MNKTWLKWTDEEVESLKIHWPHSTMKELLEAFPNRNYNMLMQKAQSLDIRSQIDRKRKGSFGFLDTLNKNSAYWWGFIMADGHLSSVGALIVTISSKDKSHLEKLATHLNCSVSTKVKKSGYGTSEMSSVVLQDISFATKWLDILNIHSPKTYTPPDLSIFYTPELFIYFFLGLIDGDGCIWISKDWPNLRIELHGNWFSTLEDMSKKLKDFYGIESKVKMTKRGTSKIDINTKEDLIKLRKYCTKVECLDRKWLRLDHF